MRTLDKQIIESLLKEKKIYYQSYLSFPINIYRYTSLTIYNKTWDPYTLQLRGMCLGQDGNILSQPFQKFFNNISSTTDEIGRLFPLDLTYEIFEKLDGSLIQVFLYDNNLVISSASSFITEQAEKAKEIILQIKPNFQPGLTYLFEIIYPENKIVLNYGNITKLTLLAVFNTITGEEISYNEVKTLFSFTDKFDIIKKVDMSLEEVLREQTRADFINKEGYVVRFSNGYRVKIKYKEYLRLHKLISGINEKYIWQTLRDGKQIPVENIPDELYEFIRSTRDKLLLDFMRIKCECYNIMTNLKSYKTRKEFALEIIKNYKEHSFILFAMYDNHQDSINKGIFKLIEPKEEKV